MDKTICVFGDSISQAAYVEKSWVDMLRKYLEGKYPDDFVNVFNLGVGGNTTRNLLNRFENEALVRSPNCIIFQVGTNDSAIFRKSSEKVIPETEFKANLHQLIKQGKGFTGDIYFVGLLIVNEDFLSTVEEEDKNFTNERLIKYDNLIKETADELKCKYIPIRNKLKMDDLSDGLHPNESGHQKIFKEIKKFF